MAVDQAVIFLGVQHGVSPDSVFLMAGLAEQIPDIFVFAMRTIPNQGVEGFIRNEIVGTRWIGTEVALCRDRFLSPTLAFDSVPGNGRMRAGVRHSITAGKGSCPALRAVLLTFWL